MDQESVSYRTLKNASYSLLGFGWPILFSVFITPIVVRRLGIVDYGVYILVNTIIGFVGLLDLGLTTAFLKYLSEYYEKKDTEGISRLASTAASMYFAVGIMGFLIFLVLGKFFLPAFHITGLSQSNIFVVFTLSGLTFFLSSVSSAYSTVPQALQRYDIVTKINLSQLTFFNFAILAAVLFGFKLKVIMFLNLVSMAGLTLAYLVYQKKILPQLKIHAAWNWAEIKKLYTFGLYAASATIANSSLNQLDRLVIPIFLGPSALSYYSLPGNVAQKTSTVVGSIGGIFLPMASGLAGQGQLEKLAQIYRKIVRNLSVVAAAAAISIMIFGFQILQYWLNRDFAERGYGVLLILAVTYYITALYGTCSNFLLGLGRVKFLAFWSVVMAVVNLAAMVILLPKFGIVGAAWAYLIGVLPIAWLFYKLEKKYLLLQGIGNFYFKLYAKLLATSAVFFVVVKFLVMKAVVNFVSLFFIGPACVLLFMLMYYLFGFFEYEDVELYRQFFGKILVKLKIKN